MEASKLDVNLQRDCYIMTTYKDMIMITFCRLMVIDIRACLHILVCVHHTDLHHSSPTQGHVGTSAEGALVNSDLPGRNVMLQTNPPHADGNIRDKGKSIVEDMDQEDATLPIPVPVLVPAPPPVPPTSTKKKCNPYSPCEGCLKFFGSPVPGRLRIRGPLMDDDDHDQPPRQKSKQSRHGPVSKSSEFRGVTFYKRTGRWESHIW